MSAIHMQNDIDATEHELRLLYLNYTAGREPPLSFEEWLKEYDRTAREKGLFLV